jgi:hypothetical protein
MAQRAFKNNRSRRKEPDLSSLLYCCWAKFARMSITAQQSNFHSLIVAISVSLISPSRAYRSPKASVAKGSLSRHLPTLFALSTIFHEIDLNIVSYVHELPALMQCFRFCQRFTIDDSMKEQCTCSKCCAFLRKVSWQVCLPYGCIYGENPYQWSQDSGRYACMD